MANGYFNLHSLGNGLEEIKFFSRDIDYDRELYESCFLEKENPEEKKRNEDSRFLCPGKPIKHKDLVKLWESGGPVKVLPMPNFEAYPFYFTNFQNLDYYDLKELLGNFLTLCEFENLKMRVTYKTEEDLRIGYKQLKKDERYNLQIFVDVGDYYLNQKDNLKNDTYEPPINKTGQRLIHRWINNGDVVTETSKNNCYPIQIRNYKELNYDELMELFSKYGKFTSIAQMENEMVQVKFCTEEAARKCFIDLKKDRHYNVRLIFFLKELNTQKKLVKDIVPSKSDAHVSLLLKAEDRIKFDPSQVAVKRESSRPKRKNKKQEEPKPESIPIDPNVFYYKKKFENGNIYIKGTPLNNPFLTPTYSYKVWKNKKNNLAAPPPECSDKMNNDVNYEYYLNNMNGLGQHLHPSCYNSR